MTLTLKTIHGVWQRVTHSEIGLIAAGIGFFGFLAIFPALAAVITIWGFAADPAVVETQLALAQNYLPKDAFDLLNGQVQRILATNTSSLGVTTLLSTLFALWSARAGVSALISGLNAIHGLPHRSGLRHVLRAFVLTLVLIGLVLSGMVLAVIVPLVLGFLPLGKSAVIALGAANFLLGMMLVMASITLAYRLGPNRTKQDHDQRKVIPGLLLSVVLWVAVSRGLVFYLSNFANYNQVYGSIGAVVALLMWFYLSAFVVLLGAALNAELEAQRAAPNRAL
ncbi:membrane protein [Pseudorhodobacter antarcticus]|jgi:membrane protein|uniref:Membrane protein n=1 Tax=Pseudorhodobacter antarcticus TaxID=1077947 RepID=A0A1H8E7U8_9RHOB|nr:YihY/virulence factor BrkB family protein [Pseudorhodobacter antarcticus]SEN15542.1 membrane protein [Pseudorhodobacter antarcticus]